MADEDRKVTGKGKGKRPMAVRMMSENPEQFARLLDVLRLGTTLTSAASHAGISPSALRYAWKWCEGNPKRKEARQWLKAVRGAIAAARSLTEAELRKSSPLVWLERGPGKLLGDDWNQSSNDESNKSESNTITQRELIAALIILRNARISIDELIDSGRIYEAINPTESNIIEAASVASPAQANLTHEVSGAANDDQSHSTSTYHTNAGEGTGMGAGGYMESPHHLPPNSQENNPSSLRDKMSDDEVGTVASIMGPPTESNSSDEPDTPVPLNDDGVGVDNFFDESDTSEVPANSNLSPDDIRKKAVADLASNSRQWRDDNKVKAKRVTPVKKESGVVRKKRTKFSVPPNKDKTVEEFDKEAVEKIDKELDHLPESLRKFLGED